MVTQTSDELSRRQELELTVWDGIVLAVTIVVAVLIPLEVVFDSLESGWVVAVSAAASVVLAWDVVLRLGGSSGEQGITGDHEVGRSKYLRSWFTVDLLAAIPFELLAIAPGVEGSSFEGPIRFLALLRVLRITRVLALQRRWRLRTSMNPAVLRLAFFAFWIVLIAHWISCGWVALDGAAAGHPELSPYHQAAYWTITTLTTVGYGDLVPSGGGQVAYAMAVMALGAAMYGYIIGNVATLIANLDVARSRHLQRMERVNTFMR
ncbi:MAG: ion transporter, partial [Acidimicrobiia bacterium]|nr:ion transporter [Acidimicrobiia bacterium]